MKTYEEIKNAILAASSSEGVDYNKDKFDRGEKVERFGVVMALNPDGDITYFVDNGEWEERCYLANGAQVVFSYQFNEEESQIAIALQDDSELPWDEDHIVDVSVID